MEFRKIGTSICVAASLLASPSYSQSLPTPAAAPIPPGFGWPAASATLVDWSQQQKVALMREHAWKLWAGINQPVAGSKKVVYETWWPVTATLHLREKGAAPGMSLRQSNAANAALHAAASGDPNCRAGGQQLTNTPCYGSPPNCPGGCLDKDGNVMDGVRYANNGDIMIAGEYYNQEAWQHIQKGKLWQKSSLNPSGSYSSIADFPHKAAVLKFQGWPVRGDGLTALPIWDGVPTQAYWNYNGYETWKRAVAIDPRAGPIPPGKTASVTYLYNVGNYQPITFPDAKVVPISRFYHRRIDKAEWDSMDPGDQCILNQSANWAYNRNFQPGDYVITLAMHIITKEMPDWAMQTFWWHDRPDEGPFAENRPANLPAGAWRNYLMTTAWNMDTPWEFDGSPYVAMNPYIELAVPELCRMTTNCQNCHTRAAFPGKSKDIPYGATYDTSVRGYIGRKDPIFEKLRRTDFQWAITDRAH